MNFSGYLWLVFLLILLFLILRNSQTFTNVIHSLSSGQIGAIVALQGKNPGQFVNG